jgi:hypothetical protein
MSDGAPSGSGDAAAAGRTRELLNAPLLPTLLRLATPNVIGLFATTVVIGYDGYILGRLGADALAGVALVFPLSMLMLLQMSNGGMGGAVASAVARALGGGRREEAHGLVPQALLIAGRPSPWFSWPSCWVFGRSIFAAMGGAGRGAGRGAGLFRCAVRRRADHLGADPAVGHRARHRQHAAARHDAHGDGCDPPAAVPTAGVWLGDRFRRWGVRGAAFSTLATSVIAGIVLAAHLVRGQGAHPAPGVGLAAAPGAASHHPARRCTGLAEPSAQQRRDCRRHRALIGSYGTAALAGYGVAARLEYIMVPIAFGFGTGADHPGRHQHGRRPARARPCAPHGRAPAWSR